MRWTIISAILMFCLLSISLMPKSSYSGPFKPLSKIEKRLCDRLKNHVAILAGSIGERNIWKQNQLNAAALYIEETLTDFGYQVEIQEFECRGLKVKNLEVERTGIRASNDMVIVGAHYDSVFGSPGANDNASGVSALLELARIFSRISPSLTVRFVAFVNEEPPFFRTEHMGSRVYALRSRQRGEHITAMLSLETIGFYSDELESQAYPFPLSILYPKVGNFIGFVGNVSSRNTVRKAISSFRHHTLFPSEGAAAPGWIPGIGWSDHWAFWKEGYPAVMITDTALFRYKHYHGAEDTPDKLQYDRMARVVQGLGHVVADLAEMENDR